MDTTRTDRGLRQFDHTAIAAMPEYAALQMAADLLAQAINRKVADGQLNNDMQRDWLDTVTDVAAVLPYSDICDGDHADDGERGVVPPCAVSIDETGWLTGRYYCPLHERMWTCGYSVTAPHPTGSDSSERNTGTETACSTTPPDRRTAVIEFIIIVFVITVVALIAYAIGETNGRNAGRREANAEAQHQVDAMISRLDLCIERPNKRLVS